MIRSLVCGLALFGLAAGVRAGELDKETKAQPTAPVVTASVGSELDSESPTAAHHRGGWGYGGGYYGGGYRSYYGGGWGGGYYGGYRPTISIGFGYGGFGGYGGYYPSYSYYRPYSYYGGYRPYYGGYGRYWW